jgi:catechol 2,3-dioxygenase
LTGQYSLPATLKIGPPTIRVRDLPKSLHFYQILLGLRVNRRHRDPADALETVELGFGGAFHAALDPLLILKHDSLAKEPGHNFAGLFHFAILVPDRKSLAVAYMALESNQVCFDGFADHLVSESLYLRDPERNGIEIYRDRSSSEWTHDAKGQVVMDTLPLDLDGMLNELTSEDRNASEAFPSGARIGHMHLRVTDLRQSAKFYQEKLGLHVSADWSQMGAMFLSAGSYHHHLGLNIWHSLGGAKHEGGEMGLDKFPISFPDYSSLIVESS